MHKCTLTGSCMETFQYTDEVRGVRLAKNDFGSVFGSVLQKTAVFSSVSALLN